MEPAMYLWCQNGCMSRLFALSPLRVSAFALSVLLPIATRSAAYQPPAPQSEQGRERELKLTAAEERDSYEIYSMLLQTEMPPQWKIQGWAIRQDTQTNPTFGVSDGNNLGVCLEPSQEQKSVYQPLIEDYVAKNGCDQEFAKGGDLRRFQ